MATVINEHQAASQTKPSRNFITKECVSCHETFVEKYWDTELDWHIELNLTRYCQKCQKK